MKVLILGISGMLGSTLYRVLSNASEYEIWGSLRHEAYMRYFSNKERIITYIDVLNQDDLIKLLVKVKPDIVINCIGIIKQRSSSKDPLMVLPINSLLPYKLSELCDLINARLVLVSTDCVFSGKKGMYREDDISDAEDLYGKSKYMGEIMDKKHVLTIRTSIIGHELNSNYSLVDWFLSQDKSVNGFSRSIFSGFPTIELANIIKNYIIPNPNLSGLYHISAKPINKFELLTLIKRQYKKQIEIMENREFVMDRSLNSEKFMEATGYVVPEWDELIRRMHDYKVKNMDEINV